jgi:two-component system chemotaxis sensor kinase CheA
MLMLDIFGLAGVARPEWGRHVPPFDSTSDAPAPASGQPSGVPTVLVVDDSDFFRGQIQRLAEAVGCRVLAAKDGQMAWELLDQYTGEVAMVATDVEMPRMDGLTLTRHIRADGRFAGLPIIALSSLAGEEEIAGGLAAGVDEYQIKLNKEELTESIRKAVRKSADRQLAATQDSGR